MTQKSWRGITSYSADVRVDQMMTSQGDGTGVFEQAAAGKAITGATNATPIVVTATGHGYSDGDFVTITGVVGNTAANGTFKIANSDANTFELTDSAGTDVAGNGAYVSDGTAWQSFVIKPGAGEFHHLERMNLVAGDSTAPTAGTYLGISKLTSGIRLEVRNAAGTVHTLTATPVKSWNDWSLNAGNDTPVLDLTAGHTDAAVRWTFSKTGPRLLLDGNAGEYLALIITDDLDGLTYQRAAVQGVL